MAAELLTIDTVALDRDAEAMNTCLSRVRSERDGMFDALMSLNRMWEGPANSEFDRQFRADMEDMAELCQTVEHLVRCMRESAAEYRKCGDQMDGAIAAVKR